MIEKLDNILSPYLSPCDIAEKLSVGAAEILVDKTNELIDAVNELQDKQATVSKMKKTEIPAKNVQDLTNWIGKYCLFWDSYGDKNLRYRARWGILTKITPNNACPFHCEFADKTRDVYNCCEPVKPDDDIIYKGGNNEHSIWHNKSETPPASTSAIVDNGTHSYYGPTGWSVTPQQRWAKIDDLLTCEKELIRTKQALDVAVSALKSATEYLGNQEPLVDVMATNLCIDLSHTLTQINQMIGDK